MPGMGGNNTVQGIFGPVLCIHQSSPSYWLEVDVSVSGLLLLDSLAWSWEASICSKLGHVSFKEVVLPQNCVTSTQFIFAFSLKLSVLTTFALLFRMMSSPAQLEQWTMIFLICGLKKELLYISELWLWLILSRLYTSSCPDYPCSHFNSPLALECCLAAILITRKDISIRIFTVCCLLSLRFHFVHAQQS